MNHSLDRQRGGDDRKSQLELSAMPHQSLTVMPSRGDWIRAANATFSEMGHCLRCGAYAERYYRLRHSTACILDYKPAKETQQPNEEAMTEDSSSVNVSGLGDGLPFDPQTTGEPRRATPSSPRRILFQCLNLGSGLLAQARFHHHQRDMVR